MWLYGNSAKCSCIMHYLILQFCLPENFCGIFWNPNLKDKNCALEILENPLASMIEVWYNDMVSYRNGGF